MTTHRLIQELLDLQNAYARVPRAIVTGERLQHELSKGAKEIDVKRQDLREPLLEHVGHLPVLASFLHSRIEHSREVNLGRVLVMLSIRDIGETVVGDVLAYDKKPGETEKENEVARKLLPTDLVVYFDEFEERETLDAKYAKSIDAIAPFLHEIGMPNLTRKRFAAYGFGSKNIEAKKRVLFEWDEVLKDMFAEILDAFHKIERGEQSGFKVVADLKID